MAEDLVLRELDSRRSDMRSYLRLAALNTVVGWVLVGLALPAFIYLLLASGHDTGAKVLGAGWLLAVIVQLMGIPYRWQDLARGRAILRQLQDLSAIAARRPVSPSEWRASLARASASGVVMDSSLFRLVDQMVAGSPASVSAAPWVAR